mgnify:CR=1 FL=1
MVTVQLKGVHVVRAKTKAGDAVYHYAWRGGPRLKGKPGTAEYVRSFHAAHESRKSPDTGTLVDVIRAFRGSPEFGARRATTKRAYSRYLDLIETEFGDLPLKALDDPNIKAVFYKWRDSMRDRPRTADYAVTTLKLLLKYAKDRNTIGHNHADEIGRLHTVDRSDSIWTDADFAAVEKHASPELMQAIRLAAFTGIRQGDLIRLTWDEFHGDSFSMVTRKTARAITVPAVAECRDLVAAIQRKQSTILTTARGGTSWTADGLRASFRKACKAAGVKRTFHDLRRTAATNLMKAALPASTVALIMGWSEESVESLKRKYVSRQAVVDDMLDKLERDR